jgi:hypothetical protein
MRTRIFIRTARNDSPEAKTQTRASTTVHGNAVQQQRPQWSRDEQSTPAIACSMRMATVFIRLGRAARNSGLEVTRQWSRRWWRQKLKPAILRAMRPIIIQVAKKCSPEVKKQWVEMKSPR